MARENQPVLPIDREAQLALAAQLLNSAGGGLLTPDDLQQVIAGQTGAKVHALMSENAGTETAAENTRLARYKTDYDGWDSKDKVKCALEEVVGRLLANNGHFLDLAEAMHESGVLFGVDEQGNPLVADKGKDPMDLPNCGLNYPNTRRAVMFTRNKEGRDLPTGYAMFPETYVGKFETFTGRPFVASEDGQTWRSAWLDSGKDPGWARSALFSPGYRDVSVNRVDPQGSDPERGVRRLLRVTKKT